MRKIILIILCLITINAQSSNIANAQTNKSTYLDFTGDGKTDWAVITTPRTADQNYRWKILANQPTSAQNPPFIRIFDYGLGTDVLLPGDYIGDRKTEATARRLGQQGIFYIAQFPSGTNGITMLDRAVQWGKEGDNPLSPGDYDGDGKLDYTVVRPSFSGYTWYILSSNTSTWKSIDFGFSTGGILPGADFTGDGRDELVFTANVNGNFTYYVGDSVTGALIFVAPWGRSDSTIHTNLPPADYTGDGKADLIAVQNNSSRLLWYILDPSTNKYMVTEFGYGRVRVEGGSADLPIQGDYDGDGKFDIAVYRFSNHTFYVLKSSDGGLIAQPWGDDSDTPLRAVNFTLFLG